METRRKAASGRVPRQRPTRDRRQREALTHLRRQELSSPQGLSAKTVETLLWGVTQAAPLHVAGVCRQSRMKACTHHSCCCLGYTYPGPQGLGSSSNRENPMHLLPLTQRRIAPISCRLSGLWPQANSAHRTGHMSPMGRPLADTPGASRQPSSAAAQLIGPG